MRVKEILPWTVESPVIQLVQPRPAAPQGHALVLDRPVVPLPRKEQTDMLRPSKQGRHAAFKKKTSYLKCDYISPSIHQLSDNPKISNNFYDLRNSRLASADVGPPSDKSCAAYTARSKSLDESSSLERRKTSPNFEEILRDLCCDLKKSDDRSERSERTSPSRISEETKCSSSDSVFYDVALDDVSAESSNETSRSDVNPRKSFSEDSFDRHRKYLAKQRNRLFEKATSKSRATSSDSCDECYDDIWKKLNPQERRRVSQMVDDLLLEIYRDNSARPVRRRSCIAMGMSRPGEATPEKRPSLASVEDNIYYTENTSGSDTFRYSSLQYKSISDLRETRRALQAEVRHLGGRLVKQLFRRDCLIARRDWHCDWITAYLQANSEKRSEDTKTRFSVTPSHGDSGFTQWQNGMRMVARLPEGIPPQFRRTLWLNLAEKHLASRGIQWQQVEEFCFNEFTNPDDEELGIQIVKDVHRTGCSLFCGVSGKDNQALLKRVLLAYARWNKAVGYCQGFNMLAALILQVMDRSEVDAVKVMIYLIEGVLPESYFANNLRGLSVDMAVFRDLLRIKLPTLSKHFDQLQIDSKDSGTSYEPPLTNVFTMQWFLTLFCNCLPQGTVLRVWDLIFLEGNHVLLATALAIWSTLADRILSVESADEFYCIMGVLTREMLEFGLMDANALIKAIVSFNLSELPELRERYLYNITPWTHSVSTVARRGLRLFYSDDDTDTEEDDDKIAIATAYGLFKSPKKKDGSNEVTSPPRALTCPDKEKIAMDISALTKQYRKLRERQKQAHVILTAACGSQSLVAPTSPAMNHLLMGKFALINNKGRRLGPPPGAIPPPSGSKSYPSVKPNTSSGETLHWKDTSTKRVSEKSGESEKTSVVSPVRDCSRRSSSSSSTSTELCDDPMRISDSEDQTNSLSECYAPPIVSGSSPLTLMQTKTHLPLDVENCRKEYTEPSITVQSTITNNLEPHKTDGQEGEMTILTPEGDDEKPQQKRKPSFKIDPEEMRQLDRKLSLKIVEIERRKSSAGIESEDLNSVLFSFDRDYIQDVEKTDRDSPASIPDDRLCSTDFVSGLEESVIIPDLITTHKPLNNRMTSLEECDETSDNEIDENLFDNDNQEDWEECGNNQGSLDNEECDENQSNLNVNEVNYDHLFARSSEYLNPTSTDNSELLELDNTYSSEQKDPDKQICQQEIDYSGKLISEPIISEQICFTSNQTKLHNTFEVDEIVQPKISTVDSPVTEESVDVSINLYSNPKLSKDSSSHCETSDSNPIKIDPKNIIQHPLNNSITNLDEKLASLLPLISTSINSDSIPPNFTSISSTDGCIKSIKKKYENFPQTSIDIKDSEAVRDETNKFLSKLENCYKINDSNVISNDINSILTKDSTLIITPIKEPHDENIEENCIIGIYNNDRTNSYDLNTGIQENTSMLNVSENSINLLKEEPKDTYSFRRENISPYHSKPDIDQTDILIQKESPKRRGSEVALSLILKENLQILSKIQQQSRRSSEICINSKNSQDPIITGSTESLIVINETAILQSKTDIDNLSKLTEITDISENKNEEGNYFRWSLKNSPDTSKSSYESKDSQIVSSSKTVVDTNFNQPFNEQNENGTEVKTSCKEEGHNHSLISEKINSFDRLCKLPDLCKLDEKIIHSSRPTQYEYSSESSTNLEGNTLQTSHVTKKDIEEFVETDTTKPYKEEKGMLLHSTKEKEEFINFSQSVFNESESFNKMSCFNKPNTQEHCLYSSNRSSLYNIVDDTKDIEIESINFPESEISNANKDILEELRSLDIEPDEVFDYFDSKVTENTTHMSKKINTSQELEEMPDSFNTSGNTLSYLTKSHHETLVRSSNTAFKYSCNERSLGLSSSSKTYTSNLFPKKQMSFDYSSDFNSDCNRSKYSAQKSYSLDTIYHDKILSKKYLNDPDSEHVNKLYSDGYDYHKQLTEKSTSNESKSKNDYHTEFETKDSQNLDDSVYSLTRNKSPIENTYYSVRQSRFSEHREFSNRERILFKYKSEDFGSSSPTHYRFSSASPIRKGLTSPSPDSSIVSSYITDRAKSSSPISATTFNKKTVPDTHTDRTALDYEYGGCRGVKKHFRTESLDLKLKKDDFSQISKKKSELLETFSSDTVLKEKKSPSSPLKFNPFPVRSYSRQPRDLGVKLGLYLPSKPDKSPTKT